MSGSPGSPRTHRSGRRLEIRKCEDVEKLGAGSGTKGVQAIAETAVEFVWPHRFGDLAKAR
jgi:hypothetical protein